MVLSGIAAATALRMWQWRPGAPVDLVGDGTSVTSWVGSVIAFGTGGRNPNLGAPFGQNLAWWSTGDVLHLSILRVLGTVLAPVDAAAVYFFLGFPLAALTMYWLARRLGAGRAAAVLVAVLFAVLPGHQTRYPHLFLASYWTIPFGLWLVVSVLDGRALWPRIRTPERTRDRAITLLAVVITGWSGAYYVAFVLVLLALALALRQVRGGSRAGTVEGVGAMAGIGILAVAAVLVDWRGRVGELVTGPAPGTRSPMEAELFGGRLTDLVLPWSEHRLDALARLSSTYRQASIDPPLEEMSLGLVAGLGALVAVVVAARVLLGRSPRSLVATLGLLAGLAFLCYTKGGFGSLVALFGTASIRAWSRMFVVIAACGLLVVAHLLTYWTRNRGWGRAPVAGLVGLLLVVGVLDQTNPAAAPDYAANAARLDQVRAVTTALQQRLDRDCAVFQLPVLSYPENQPRYRIQGYDLLLPSLTSTQLRWSYGALKGTAAADWQLGLDEADPEQLFDDLAATDFCAVLVARDGYPPDPAIERAARASLGAPLVDDPNARMVAFDLRPRRAALRSSGVDLGAARDAVLHPVLVQLVARDAVADPAGRAWQPIPPNAALDVANLSSDARGPVTVRLLVQPVGDARTLTVTYPGGRSDEVSLAAGTSTPVTLTVPSAASGRTSVRLALSGTPVLVPDVGSQSARVHLVDATTAGGVHTVVVQPLPVGGPATLPLEPPAANSR